MTKCIYSVDERVVNIAYIVKTLFFSMHFFWKDERELIFIPLV